LYSGDLFCQFRDGTKMVAPAESGACWPLFEVMMTDDYRLAELRLESAPTLIVDIGAHVGSAAVRLSRMFPQAAVVCYEPNPGTARYLRANLALNGVVADVVEAAVAGEPGTGNLEGSAGLATSTVLLSGKPDLSATRVPVLSYSEEMSRLRPAGPVLVKMDCEGGEYAILDGSSEDDWKYVEVVLLEYHPIAGRGGWRELSERFAAFGLVPDWHRPNERRTDLGLAMLRRVGHRVGQRAVPVGTC
jgi:FkbM family methyltransferase